MTRNFIDIHTIDGEWIVCPIEEVRGLGKREDIYQVVIDSVQVEHLFIDKKQFHRLRLELMK